VDYKEGMMVNKEEVERLRLKYWEKYEEYGLKILLFEG
jgi:hypothetical protein